MSRSILTVAETADQGAGVAPTIFIAVFVLLVTAAVVWAIVAVVRRPRKAVGYNDVSASGGDPAAADRDALRKAAGGGTDQYARQPFNQSGS